MRNNQIRTRPLAREWLSVDAFPRGGRAVYAEWLKPISSADTPNETKRLRAKPIASGCECGGEEND
jgi:hypothetical protein